MEETQIRICNRCLCVMYKTEYGDYVCQVCGEYYSEEE